jgi:hypothetical protein
MIADCMRPRCHCGASQPAWLGSLTSDQIVTRGMTWRLSFSSR